MAAWRGRNFGIEVGDEALYSLYMICGFDSCMIIREAGNI